MIRVQVPTLVFRRESDVGESLSLRKSITGFLFFVWFGRMHQSKEPLTLWKSWIIKGRMHSLDRPCFYMLPFIRWFIVVSPKKKRALLLASVFSFAR